MNLQPDRPTVVDVRRLNRSAEAVTRAQPLTSYHGICAEHDRPVRYDADQDCGPKAKIPCPETDHLIDGDRLVAVKTNVTCEGSCQAAVSDKCSCGCGGANHGLMWMWQMAVQLGADPRGILDGAPLGTRREVLETELEKWRARQRQVQARKPEQAERRREAIVRRARVTFEAWAEQHKDTIAALAPFRHDSGDNFLQSLAIQVTDGWNGKPKPLSEAQEAAVFRAIEDIGRRQRQQAERQAARRPAPEGKARISGRVVKVTYRRRDRNGDEFRFGPEHRMVVSCDGYAVQSPAGPAPTGAPS